MFYKSAYYHAQHITTSNRYRTYIHFSAASQSARRRVNGQISSYLQEIIFIPRKRSHPSMIDKLSMFHKSAYYHAQHSTTSNRYRAYIHFSGAVSYTHLRAHETGRNLVCRLLLEKKIYFIFIET